jgi:excisionase family DNA binding protein
MPTLDDMLTVTQAAQRVGRTPGTIRRWIREGRLVAETTHGHRLIAAGDLARVRDDLYPMLPLPPEWERLEDGTPAPNWAAAVALSRRGR